MDFLYSRNRLNVATSRARCVAVVVASPDLLRVRAPDARADAARECVLPLRRAGRRRRPAGGRTGCRHRGADARPRLSAARIIGGHGRPHRPPPARLEAARRRSHVVARGRRGARQHRAHRGGHGRLDRGPAHRRARRCGAASPAPPSSSAPRLAPSSLSAAHGPPRPADRARGRVRHRGRRRVRGDVAVVVGRRCRCCCVGTFLIGFGNSSNQLSRYAAADLYPDARRASAIGLVVWGATVGAVIGPNLGRAGRRVGDEPRPARARRPVPRPDRLRRRAAAILSLDAAATRSVRARRRDVARRIRRPTRPSASSLASVLRRPHVPVAIVALVDGPGRDGPDHDDDAAPHDRARPHARRGRRSSSAATRSGCSGCRRSPAG